MYGTADDAQNPANHAGKILRLNDDGTVPSDNPFVGKVRYRPEIYALGIRNAEGVKDKPDALLGLVLCGVCGERMKVVCHLRAGQRVPDYVCDGRTVDDPQPICQWIAGSEVDAVVSDLLLDIMAPVAIDVTLAVQQELQTRLDDVDRLRREQVERARYEAELAQRRYLRVDPDNRLVADALEVDWNRKLRALHEAQQDYKQQRQKDRLVIDNEPHARLHVLATDFPRVWRDPTTPASALARIDPGLLTRIGPPHVRA